MRELDVSPDWNTGNFTDIERPGGIKIIHSQYVRGGWHTVEKVNKEKLDLLFQTKL